MQERSVATRASSSSTARSVSGRFARWPKRTSTSSEISSRSSTHSPSTAISPAGAQAPPGHRHRHGKRWDTTGPQMATWTWSDKARYPQQPSAQTMRDADVIVVGAGAGGPVAARVLSEAGLSVLLFDAGPWLDPDRCYSQLEDDMFAMANGKLRWGPADRRRDPWQRKRVGVSVLLQSAGVGGCTRHYNGIASRAISSSINGEGPLAYQELQGA